MLLFTILYAGIGIVANSMDGADDLWTAAFAAALVCFALSWSDR